MLGFLNSQRSVGISISIFGCILLACSNIPWGWVVMLISSLFMITIGYWRKEGLWIMPGSILLGVALATMLCQFSELSSQQTGGVFTLSASLGWFGVTFLSKRFTASTLWWPVIPGIIMILLGWWAIQTSFLQVVLNLVRLFWAFMLIVLGTYVWGKALFDDSQDPRAGTPQDTPTS
ncbi:MAG: hypothetical protein R2880_09625 [Deinococcales bacterium]